MYPLPSGKIQIKKGYMNFGHFIGDIKNIPSFTKTDIVFHCRITTHGKTNRQNCHPFPLAGSMDELVKTETQTEIGVAHNGQIRFIQGTKKYSDTMFFIAEYLHELGDGIFSPAAQKIILEATNSKFAFMKADEVALIGEFIKKEGIYYSNDSYRGIRYWGFSGYDLSPKNKSVICDFCGKKVRGEVVEFYDTQSKICSSCYKELHEWIK